MAGEITKVYKDSGGNRQVVASGGTILINSGGAIDASAATASVLFAAGEVAQVDIAAASLDGTIAKVVAESAVIGGIPLVYAIPIASGALADTDIVVAHKIRVLDAWLVLRAAGVANTTLQVKNATNAISDAMAASGSDTALVRAATINDANYEIAAAGTLRVTSATGASQPAAVVYVTCMRVA